MISVVDKHAILPPAQDVEGVPIQSYLQVPAADEGRRSHVNIHVSQLAVSPYHNPFLGHVVVEVSAFQLGVRSRHLWSKSAEG